MTAKLTQQLAHRLAELRILLPPKMWRVLYRGNVLVVFDLSQTKRQVDIVKPDNTTKGLAQELARIKRRHSK